MSSGQIALAFASAVLAVSLLILAAAWLRRPPSGPSSLASTVKAVVQSAVASSVGPVDDPLGALLDRVLAERERAARARLLSELVDGDVDVALDRLRALLDPKGRTANAASGVA